MEENTSWWQELNAEKQEKSTLKLTPNDLQYPEKLSVDVVREYLVKRCIIQSGNTQDKETLFHLFRIHVSPLPQRNERVDKLNAEVKAVSLNRSLSYDKSRVERKRKMDSPGEEGDLTVKIPLVNKADNKPTKPVKLKRKSYDIGKQRPESSADAIQKNPLEARQSEISHDQYLSTPRKTIKSLHESSDAASTTSITFNIVDTSKSNSTAEVNATSQRNFGESSNRKVRLAEDAEKNAISGVLERRTDPVEINDNKKPKSNDNNQKAKNYQEDKMVEEEGEILKETIHVSIGTGKIRSTIVVSKDEDESTESQSAVEHFESEEQSQTNNKDDILANSKSRDHPSVFSRLHSELVPEQPQKSEDDSKYGKTSDCDNENTTKHGNNDKNPKEKSEDRHTERKRDRKSSRSRSRSRERKNYPAPRRDDARRRFSTHRRTPPRSRERDDRRPVRPEVRLRGPPPSRHGPSRHLDSRFHSREGGRPRQDMERGRRSPKRESRNAEQPMRRRSPRRRSREKSSESRRTKDEKTNVENESKSKKEESHHYTEEERKQLEEEVKKLDLQIQLKALRKKDRMKSLSESDGTSAKPNLTAPDVTVESASINLAIHSTENSTQVTVSDSSEKQDSSKTVSQRLDKKDLRQQLTKPKNQFDEREKKFGTLPSNDSNGDLKIKSDVPNKSTSQSTKITSIKADANKQNVMNAQPTEVSKKNKSSSPEESIVCEKVHKKNKKCENDSSTEERSAIEHNDKDGKGSTSEGSKSDIKNDEVGQTENDDNNKSDKHSSNSDNNPSASSSNNDSSSSNSDDSDDNKTSESDSSDESEPAQKKKSKKKRKKKKSRRRRNSGSDSDSSDERTDDDSDGDKEKSRKRKRKRKRRKKSKKLKRKRKKSEKENADLALIIEQRKKLEQERKKMEEILKEWKQSNMSAVTTQQQQQNSNNSNRNRSKENKPDEKDDCNDSIELDYSSEEDIDQHGFPTGIPLRNGSSELVADVQPTEVAKKEEIVEVFNSGDDILDLELDEDEGDDNWKRQKKDAVGENDSTKDKENNRSHRDERRESRHSSNRGINLGINRKDDRKSDRASERYYFEKDKRRDNSKKYEDARESRHKDSNSSASTSKKESADPHQKQSLKLEKHNDSKVNNEDTYIRKGRDDRKESTASFEKVPLTKSLKRRDDSSQERESRKRIPSDEQPKEEAMLKKRNRFDIAPARAEKPSDVQITTVASTAKQDGEKPFQSFDRRDETAKHHDGIAIAKEVRQDVYKLNNFWKTAGRNKRLDDSSSENIFDERQKYNHQPPATTHGNDEEPSTTTKNQEILKDDIGHWEAPYVSSAEKSKVTTANIGNRLLNIAGPSYMQSSAGVKLPPAIPAKISKQWNPNTRTRKDDCIATKTKHPEELKDGRRHSDAAPRQNNDNRRSDYEQHGGRDRRYSDSSTKPTTKYVRENSDNIRNDQYKRDHPLSSYSGRKASLIREEDERGYRNDDKRYNQDRPPLTSSNRDTSYTRQRKLSNGHLPDTSLRGNNNIDSKSSNKRFKSEIVNSKFPISLSRLDGGDSPSINDDVTGSFGGNRPENFTHPEKHYRGRKKR